MTKGKLSLLDEIKMTLRWALAGLAMYYCAPELLYWNDPQRWEEYMSEGEPYCPNCATAKSAEEVPV